MDYSDCDMDSYQSMLHLVKTKKEKKVISSLEDENVLYHNADRIALLHIAARYGKKKLLQYLLNSGCDVNSQDSLGRTPLMMAIKGNHTVIIETLLAAGANMFILDHSNMSTLQQFFANHSLTSVLCDVFTVTFLSELRKKCLSSEQMAQIMIDAGCQFYQAAFSKDVKIIEYMHRQGLPIHSVHPLHKTTALQIAIMLEDVKSMKVLLKYGSDPKALDLAGFNAFAYIYLYNEGNPDEKIEMLQILFDLGVCPTFCASIDCFQIRNTLFRGNSEAIHVVLQSSIDFAAIDPKKRNLLHYLASNINSTVVDQIKPHINKLDVNKVDIDGRSPLHVAVICKNVEMVKFLLDQGAKTNIAEYKYGYTPLHYGYSTIEPEFQNQNNQIIDLLLQHSADIQFIVTEKNEQYTILDYALGVNDINRTKTVIAHIAMIEGLGTRILPVIYSEIQSHKILNKYFNRCRYILTKNIFKSITILKLLTDHKKKMAKHSGNKHLVLKLKRMSCKPNIKYTYVYYWNTLSKQFLKGREYNNLKNHGKRGLSKIFHGLIRETNLITDNIIEYLENEDLQQLYHL